ncbi:putative protein OS=Bosea thiooxidans OX=53254 GN=SAMN05660750_04084 PE=4 SV=1 [Bosea thiooxidans]|uniref:Uncharacterized protein n=1 Tax=Bosea thiooxidans TaxID=53254 RepID=A0A1T5GID2_9HYPH|nr:hypothetical protein [Bosea thiooxidans]SKC08136.1 hypothetical protein SAMN05660750_04084 [Bosea thiooxidans]
MISSVISSMPFKAPADPNDAAGRRAVLEILRAADNDNTAPPRLDADDDRATLLKPEFAARLMWKRLRELAESTGAGSNWYGAAHAFDDSAPSAPEASVENLWPVETLLRAAHDGVDYRLQDGRVVPYGGCSGALEYSEATGRAIQVGRLVLADDLRTEAANDDEATSSETEEDADRVEIVGGIRRPASDGEAEKKDRDEGDEPEPLGIDEAIATLAGEPIRRGNVSSDSSYNARIARAGSITGIRHRTRAGKVITLTRPRNMDGAYRDRCTEPPPPIQRANTEDAIDARQRLARLEAVLPPQTVAILDFSIDATSFEAIGEFIGKSGEYARKAGRRALIKACAELDAAMNQNKFYYAA